METIKAHLRERTYSPTYLLYGSEAYLKRLYREQFRKGLLGDDDGMNYSYFEGKEASPGNIMEMAETLPFFADKRLVVIENSGLFKNQSPLADFLPTIPETTHLIFMEDEQGVDKRNRLYKAVAKLGTVAHVTVPDTRALTQWVASTLAKSDKKVTSQTAHYFVERVGTDMERLSTEMEKLVCYAMEREVIATTDVDAVCTVHISNEIFQMVDAVATGKKANALKLYHNLLALRERPMGVLFLLVRQFNALLQIMDLPSSNNADVASKIGVPPFVVNKYRAQAKRFTADELRQILDDCASIEADVKLGRMEESLAVELLILR